MFGKRKLAALAAEFLGTAVLSFTFLTVSRSTIGIPYFVGVAAGLSILLMGISLGRDVHLNPALTFALWTARRIRTLKAATYIVAQMLGGWAAYGLYHYLSKGQVQALSTNFDSHILVAEAVGTFVFAFAAAGVIYQRVHWLVRAVVVGGAFTLGVIVASSAANGFINPAVALASHGWAWGTSVLGPILGGIIGVNLYGLLFATPEQMLPLARSDKAEKVDRKIAKAETVTEEKAVEVREKVVEKTDKVKSGRNKKRGAIKK